MYGKAQFVIYLLYRNSGRSRMFYYNFFLASDSAFGNCFCCIGYIVLLCASASCRLCTSCHNYYYYIRLYWLRLIRLAQYPMIIISIHAPRVRCDQSSLLLCPFSYISIHAPRVRCDIIVIFIIQVLSISIHAPRVRCDWYGLKSYKTYQISIHAPRVRCDAEYFPIADRANRFQSTHLV